MKQFERFLLITSLLFCFLFRYPNSYLQKGSDSFGNHLVSLSIIDNGFDLRYVNTLSFFGLFPGSNNMGGAFLLSTVSLISDVSIGEAIFIITLFLTLIGALAIFMFTKEFTDSNIIAIFSIILFVTSRRYIAYTEFTYTYRAIYISIFPILFYLVIKQLKNKNLYNFKLNFFALTLFFLLSLASIHRMFFINGLVIFTSIFYLFVLYFTNFNPSIYKKYKPYYTLIVTLIISLAYILSVSGYSFYSGSSDYTLEKGKTFFNSDLLIFSIINLSLLYSMSFGIFLPLSIIGYFYLFINNKKINIFLIVLLFSYSFIWTDITYGFIVLLPVVTLLASIGFYKLFEYFNGMNLSTSNQFPLFIVILLAGNTIPELVVINESEYSYIREDMSYSRNVEYEKSRDAGMYLSFNDEDHMVISSLLSVSRVSIYSGADYRGSQLINNSEYFAYESVKFTDFISGNLNYLYTVSDENLDRDLKYNVFLSDYSWNSQVSENNIKYVFNGGEEFIVILFKGSTEVEDDYGVWSESTFFFSITEDNYNFYDNGYHTIYKIRYE